MNLFKQTGGLLGESDVISLSPQIRLRSYRMIDTVSEAKHLVQPDGWEALRSLRHPVKAQHWFDQNTQNSISDLAALISSLTSIGALIIRRSAVDTAKHAVWRLKARLLFVPLGHLSRRYPANYLNLTWQVLVACLPVFITSGSVFGLSFAAQLLPNITAGNYLATLSVIWMMLWLSNVAHEMMHIKIIKQSSKVVLVRRRLRIGILHGQLSPTLEALSALLGPIVGALFCLILGWICFMIGGSRAPLYIGAGFALLHSLSWLPFFGDGKAVSKFIASKLFVRSNLKIAKQEAL